MEIQIRRVTDATCSSPSTRRRGRATSSCRRQFSMCGSDKLLEDAAGGLLSPLGPSPLCDYLSISDNSLLLYIVQRISVCGSCSSFMLWCSSCRARPSGHVLICLGLVHIVALQRGALAIFFCLDLVHIVALQSSVLLYHWQYSNLHNLYLGSFESS